MVAAVKYQCFTQDVGRKLHNLDTDTLKIALTNSAPNAATHTVIGDVTQVANGNGYTTGGTAVANTDYTQTAGVGTLIGDDVVFTATGSMGPFRYAVLYNDTAAADNLIQSWDYGSAITLANTETFTVNFGANILTLT
jgi:hypothetical protein